MNFTESAANSAVRIRTKRAENFVTFRSPSARTDRKQVGTRRAPNFFWELILYLNFTESVANSAVRMRAKCAENFATCRSPPARTDRKQVGARSAPKFFWELILEFHRVNILLCS